MRLNITQSPPQNITSSLPFLTSKKHPLYRSPSCILPLSSKSTVHNHLRRSCSANFDGHDFPTFNQPIEDFHMKKNTHKLNFPTSRYNSSTSSSKTPTTTTSFKQYDCQVDVLEPSLLGIRPEPPDWPARDAMIRECIARRASSIELPLSLRMIKMKQKLLKLEMEKKVKDFDEYMNDSEGLNKLCCLSLYVIREIQSMALENRGFVLDDGVVCKVQREMSCSFIWLFKEVFAKTPCLMLQVMVLTCDFATFELGKVQSFEEKGDVLVVEGENSSRNSGFCGVKGLELGKSGVVTKEVLESMEESEVGLWKSIVGEANKLVLGGGGDFGKNQGLGFVVDDDNHDDHDVNGYDVVLSEKRTEFVSPVRVEIEKDDYEEYYRTEILYQMGLFQDPNNTLLLSNYAQFLCLVSRDYDRAEECFKRAIQLDPKDGEVMTQYANFLWVVRKDLWGAEERFQQAMAAEPSNSYHASKYASFLWSTGGEDTCYPIDSSRG